MLPAARDAVIAAMARWANPSSPHAEGRAARAALEDARARIKQAFGWGHHLIFTSGATEAAFIALNRQSSPRPIFVSAVEHAAVLRQREDATLVGVGSNGEVDLARLGEQLEGHDRPLVAIQYANSETGIVQPLEEVRAATDAAGGILFVDCAQSAGKLALPDADLIAVSAHKFGGPPGIGALLVRDLALLSPFGGSQEQGYRAGTESLPAIMGFAAAAEADPTDGVPADWVLGQVDWRQGLNRAIVALGGEVVGGSGPSAPLRIPTISAYRMPGVKAATQLIRLDMMGIAVSAGSACSSGSIHSSHVLRAMGMADDAADEVIRVSFGRSTSLDAILHFEETWGTIARDIRSRAA